MKNIYVLKSVNRFNQLMQYLQMLDLKEERVKLASFDTIQPNEVASRIPTDAARYHFYRYAHNFEGDYLESISEYRKQYWYCLTCIIFYIAIIISYHILQKYFRSMFITMAFFLFKCYSK